MKCVCGNDRFFAHQVCYHDVIVDEDGEFLDNDEGMYLNGIYASDKPYGPFVCDVCGREYDELV